MYIPQSTGRLHLLHKIQNVKVSVATDGDSSNAVKYIQKKNIIPG